MGIMQCLDVDFVYQYYFEVIIVIEFYYLLYEFDWIVFFGECVFCCYFFYVLMYGVYMCVGDVCGEYQEQFVF